MVYGADPNEGGSDMDKETRIRKRSTRLEVLTVALVLVLGSLTASAVTLDVVSPAAHCGVYGLKVSFTDTSPGYVQDNKPSAESRYVVQFYFNASLASLSGSGVEVFTAYSGTEGSGTPAFQVFLGPTGVSGAVAAVTASGVGVSLSSPFENEIKKLHAAVSCGADTVMDLSTKDTSQSLK